MLELRFIRENIDLVKEKIKFRNIEHSRIDDFIAIDKKRRELLSEVEGLRNRRKTVSKEIAELKKKKEDADGLIAEMKTVGPRIKELDKQLAIIEEDLEEIVMEIPNLTHDSIPFGNDDSDNVEIRKWGTVPEFNFEPKAHWELGEASGTMDFKRAAKLAGARFSILKGMASRLERALINFMMDLHTQKHGYEEVLPPFLVNSATMTATGQLPKFEEDLFKAKGWDLYLIPTAEVPVTNIHRDETLAEAELPIKYCAYTPCFRSEAGSYGRDTKGMIRQHQFDKVELVKFTTPESSDSELEALLADAEEVLQLLKLPYRVVTLCSGDLGFSATNTFDIEVWAAGVQRFLEVSSVSIYEQFQARRANIRYRSREGKVDYVHTMNGSGLATSRIFPAIIENNQTKDGRIRIPGVLRPYLDGAEYIE